MMPADVRGKVLAGSGEVVLIIPARNEELSLPTVLRRVPAVVSRVVVVDNGSTDTTAAVARTYGAEVVHEPLPGYGSACLANCRSCRQPSGRGGLCRADGSDGVENLTVLLAPLLKGEADLALSRRVAVASRALSLQQRFGNWLATRLIRLVWGHDYQDLGPMRVITWSALGALDMRDRNFGWTVEMQIRAAGGTSGG
jgi:cellulose synthase/poly-beta-1,6-N-acetylglucosamine synthase-like glycosyltransferase